MFLLFFYYCFPCRPFAIGFTVSILNVAFAVIFLIVFLIIVIYCFHFLIIFIVFVTVFFIVLLFFLLSFLPSQFWFCRHLFTVFFYCSLSYFFFMRILNILEGIHLEDFSEFD